MHAACQGALVFALTLAAFAPAGALHRQPNDAPSLEDPASVETKVALGAKVRAVMLVKCDGSELLSVKQHDEWFFHMVDQLSKDPKNHAGRVASHCMQLTSDPSHQLDEVTMSQCFGSSVQPKLLECLTAEAEERADNCAEDCTYPNRETPECQKCYGRSVHKRYECARKTIAVGQVCQTCRADAAKFYYDHCAVKCLKSETAPYFVKRCTECANIVTDLHTSCFGPPPDGAGDVLDAQWGNHTFWGSFKAWRSRRLSERNIMDLTNIQRDWEATRRRASQNSSRNDIRVQQTTPPKHAKKRRRPENSVQQTPPAEHAETQPSPVSSVQPTPPAEHAETQPSPVSSVQQTPPAGRARPQWSHGDRVQKIKRAEREWQSAKRRWDNVHNRWQHDKAEDEHPPAAEGEDKKDTDLTSHLAEAQEEWNRKIERMREEMDTHLQDLHASAGVEAQEGEDQSREAGRRQLEEAQAAAGKAQEETRRWAGERAKDQEEALLEASRNAKSGAERMNRERVGDRKAAGLPAPALREAGGLAAEVQRELAWADAHQVRQPSETTPAREPNEGLAEATESQRDDSERRVLEALDGGDPDTASKEAYLDKALDDLAAVFVPGTLGGDGGY